jgi:hypothetical protein
MQQVPASVWGQWRTFYHLKMAEIAAEERSTKACLARRRAWLRIPQLHNNVRWGIFHQRPQPASNSDER